jgi:2-polyprenyl-3-methyl-5-hydroxy-6-metoxy-1,4-benzoquinol methylase
VKGAQRRPPPGAGAAGWRRRLYGSRFEACFGDGSTFGGLSPSVRAYFDQHVRRHLPDDRRAAILDVGCGFGGLLMYLRDLGYACATGVDASPEQVAMAHRLGLGRVTLATASEYLAGRAEELDLVLAVDVLEHLTREELLQVLDAIHAALRPGGRLLVQVPNAGSPFGGRLRYDDLTHEQAFTRSSIAQALRAAGFTRVSVHSVQPAVHGPASAVRWALWRLLRLGLVACLAIETGALRGHVVSRNLIAVAER